MFKPLLIAMLVAAQLSTGSGVSAYVCIGDDGWFRIDAGAESCSACRSVCCTKANLPARDTAQSCCRHPGERKAESAQSEVSAVEASGSCDCTHIPVMVSSEQSAKAVRNLISCELEDSSSSLACQPTIGDIFRPAVDRLGLHRSRFLQTPDFSLVVVSSVVLRC